MSKFITQNEVQHPANLKKRACAGSSMFNEIRNAHVAARFILWTVALAGLIIPLQAAEPSKPLPPRQTVRFAPTGEILFNPGGGLFQTCSFIVTGTNAANTKVWTEEEIKKKIEEQFDVLPYISTVYYRFNWVQLEPEEGKYRWDDFESNWRPWVDHGKKIAFRIMAYCPSGVFPESKEIFYHTPKYVFDAGALGFINYGVSM